MCVLVFTIVLLAPESINTLIVAGFGLPGEVQILVNVIGIECSTFCLLGEEWPARVLRIEYTASSMQLSKDVYVEALHEGVLQPTHQA